MHDVVHHAHLKLKTPAPSRQTILPSFLAGCDGLLDGHAEHAGLVEYLRVQVYTEILLPTSFNMWVS